MSILIKGMEMPTSCAKCRISFDIGNEYLCQLCTDPNPCVVGGEFWRECGDEGAERRPVWCPLIEVPPHGRLIDADAFIKEINERIEAAIKWGTNAIADRNDEIKLRAEQAVATFCETSLTAKKLPTIIEAEVVDGVEG